MTDSIVTVFGGTGFLGSRIVRHLRDRNVIVRVVSRHPARTRELFRNDPNVQPTVADVHDDAAVAEAISGASGVVNAVSLYVESGSATFRSVHVEAAHRVACAAHMQGIGSFVHVSGIGADAASKSSYIRNRGEGEITVRSALRAANIVRPAVMFGPDDAFVTQIVKMLRRLPVYPLFGHGDTRLQPAYVEDVAEAVVTLLQGRHTGEIFECAGPRVYSYRELLATIADTARVRVRFVPLPFAVWHALARIAEMLPQPPLTRNQVALMEEDSTKSESECGFDQLDIAPRSLEEILPSLLRKEASL